MSASAPAARSLRYFTLDVFTDRRFGGNPLAVVLEADGLPQGRLQTIAREFNLSETVFLQKPTQAGALIRARIFTPTEELPFAGHPTVGTACLLADLGLAPAGDSVSFALEEKVGLVQVRVDRRPGQAPFAELTAAQAPSLGPPPPETAALAAVLGLPEHQIAASPLGPAQASCGLPFLLVPVTQPEVLAGIEVDTAALRRLLAGGWARNLFVYAHGHEEGELRGRMFSPTIGEDPATGSAACALAGRLALAQAADHADLRWTLHQGVEMGRPSQLFLQADRRQGAVTAVRVGGHSVQVSEGLLHVD